VRWCQLLAEMQEYASQPSQPPGNLSAAYHEERKKTTDPTKSTCCAETRPEQICVPPGGCLARPSR